MKNSIVNTDLRGFWWDSDTNQKGILDCEWREIEILIIDRSAVTVEVSAITAGAVDACETKHKIELCVV